MMRTASRILIIDDDTVIRLSCKLALKNKGMIIDLAENGIVGLQKIKSRHYDLVILGIMVTQKSGDKIIEEIRNHDEHIIIIIITGHADIKSAIITLKKGVYDYLQKPFTPDALRQALRKGLMWRQLIIETKQLRKEREQNLLKLAAEQSRLTAITNCMGEGLIATDQKGELILINPVACKLLNLEQTQQTGRHIKGNLNNEALENLILQTLDKNQIQQRYRQKEITFALEQGIIYSLTLALITDNDCDAGGLAVVIRDVSEEKKLEKMKSEFQKLVFVVTHELKAPINTIEGYIDLIVKGYTNGKPEKQKEYMTRVHHKTGMLQHLIEDFLSLTAIESGKIKTRMKPIDIREILNEISTFMEIEAKNKGIKIIQKYPGEIPLIRGDKNALNCLFANLMSNAIKYNKENGNITLVMKKQDNFLVTSVTDTGIGILEDDQRKIFDEFYRSPSEIVQKITGTGLGLSTTKHIADLHNGYLEVKSKCGEGSQFDVYLPILNEE